MPATPIPLAFVLHGQHYGGLEKRLTLLVSRLDRRRFIPHVICLSKGRLWERLGSTGAIRHLVPMPSRFDLSAAPRLAATLRTIQPGLLQTHSVRTNLLGRYCATRLGIPLVANVGAPYLRDTNQTLRPKRINARVERLTARWTGCFITVNQQLADMLVAEGVPRPRIRVIYNGIESPPRLTAPTLVEVRRRLQIPADSLVVGFAGALRPRKGLEVLLQAFAGLHQRSTPTTLVCVGDPEFAGAAYAQQLHRLAERLQIVPHVRWVGFQEDVWPFLQLLDLVVLPSLFGEGCPSALLEAWALQRPVVATETEGIRELIENGVSGRLVPPDDPTTLAQALDALLDDPQARQRYGRAGFDAVQQRFTCERMVHEYEDVYTSLLGGRP